jgi:hypothetical protein
MADTVETSLKGSRPGERQARSFFRFSLDGIYGRQVANHRVRLMGWGGRRVRPLTRSRARVYRITRDGEDAAVIRGTLRDAKAATMRLCDRVDGLYMILPVDATGRRWGYAYEGFQFQYLDLGE